MKNFLSHSVANALDLFGLKKAFNRIKLKLVNLHIKIASFTSNFILFVIII